MHFKEYDWDDEIDHNGPRPGKYWNTLKTKLKAEGSELSHKLGQLKMESAGGKFYKTNVTSTDIFHLSEDTAEK
jgi:hypothetical protein